MESVSNAFVTVKFRFFCDLIILVFFSSLMYSKSNLNFMSVVLFAFFVVIFPVIEKTNRTSRWVALP